VGAFFIQHLDGFEVVHEAGEVFEVAPEGVDLLDGLVNGDRFFDADVLVQGVGEGFAADEAFIGAAGGDVEGFIEVALAGDAAVDHAPAGEGGGGRGEAEASDALGQQEAADEDGDDAFDFADVGKFFFLAFNGGWAGLGDCDVREGWGGGTDHVSTPLIRDGAAFFRRCVESVAASREERRVQMLCHGAGVASRIAPGGAL
jgi:hypothetical protein